MANPKRLTLGDSKIQIFFDGDTAQYIAPPNLELAAVVEEIEKWREFVEQWVEAAEPPKPPRLMREQREVLEILEKFAITLRRCRTFSKYEIESLLVQAATWLAASKFPSLDEEQARHLVSEVMSTI